MELVALEKPVAIAPLRLPADWLAEAAPARTSRRVWIQSFAVLAALVVILFAVAKIVPHVAGRPQHPAVSHHRVELSVLFGLWLVLFPLVLFAHEGGHAIGGMLSGWHVESLFLGPLRLMREDGRLRVRLHRIYMLYGGAILAIPREWPGEDRIRIEFRRMVAGGPITSLIIGVALLGALVAMHIPFNDTFASAGPLALFLAGAMSLVIGLGTLIPIRQGAHLRNDGLQLWLLRRGRRGTSRPLDPALCDATARLVAWAKRPREWDPRLLEQIGQLPIETQSALEYYRMLDHADARGAGAALNEHLACVAANRSRMGTMLRAGAAIEAALFESAWRGDLDAAKAWLARAPSGERADPHSWSLASAGIALARGELQNCRATLAEAELAMRRSSIASTSLLRAATIDRLREASERAEAAGRAQPS